MYDFNNIHNITGEKSAKSIAAMHRAAKKAKRRAYAAIVKLNNLQSFDIML